MSRGRRRFVFPGAGELAPAPIRALIAVFRRLPETKRGQGSLWAWLLGPMGTPPYKLDPTEVNYTAPSNVPGQACANCQRLYKHPVTGVEICDAVRGRIYAADWCDRWMPPLPAATYIEFQGGDARTIVQRHGLEPGEPVVTPYYARHLKRRFVPLMRTLAGVALGAGLGVLLTVTSSAHGADVVHSAFENLGALASPDMALLCGVVREGGLPAVLALIFGLYARGIPLRVTFSDVDREILRHLGGRDDGHLGGRDDGEP